MITVLIFAVMLVATASIPPAVEAASLKEQIASARERQEKLNQSIARSQKLVSELQRDQAATKNALNATKDDISDTKADIDATREQIDRVKERLKKIEAKHAALVDEQRQTDHTLGLLEQELEAGEDDLRARRDSFQLRMAEAYRSQNTTLLEQVFTAESFSDVLTDTSAYLSYGDQDAQLADQIVEDQQALDNLRLLTTSTRLQTDQLRRDTLETQAKVEELKKDLREAERRLNKLKRKQESLLDRQRARLESIYKNKKQVQKAINAQVAQRNRLRNSIASKLASMNRRATATFGVRAGAGGGRFAWPATGNISQGYGCTGYYYNPPRGSCPHFHDGIDIANASGTPILAAADGIVTFVGFNPWEAVPAYIIVIAHGGGVSSLYAHMQPRQLVRVGQKVRKRQRIAYMGSTGGSFGSHLHFEVWAGGDWSPVNPYAYL